MKKETKVILTILVNNVVDESTLLAEHGISILVTIQNEIGFYDTIMDTGQKSATLLYNIKELNIDISKLMINSIIISHGHYDHTGGLKNLLKNLYKHNPIPVIAHPDIFIPRISYLGGFRSISCPFTPSEIRQAGGELLLTRDPVKINNYLTTTGEVPRKNKYEINPLFRKIVNDQWIEDEVDDDLSLIINVNKESFFLLCGCCHAGLINTLARAKELTGKSKCYGIMGGLHLIGATQERIDYTINELKKWAPEVIIPLHCSGREAMCELRNHFPNSTKFLDCGDSFSLQIES